MRLVPYDTFAIDSALPVAEVQQRLAALIGESFIGTMNGDSFTISRVVPGRNVFLPVVIGQVLPREQGSRLEGRLRMSLLSIAGTIGWTILVLLGMTGALIKMSRGVNTLPGMLIFVGMLLFGLVLMEALFWIEVRKAREVLSSVAQGGAPSLS